MDEASNQPAPNHHGTKINLTTLFLRFQGSCAPQIVGKQTLYDSVEPPDQAFDRLILWEGGFRRKDKHVLTSRCVRRHDALPGFGARGR